MARTKQKARKNGLRAGRPPTAAKAKASLSRKVAQKVIRSHHVLNKQLASAKSKGNDEVVKTLEKRIADRGGLKAYQAASIQGQASDRGGDSSEVLMNWLQDIKPTLTSLSSKIRMLEVGSLSTKNACSKSGLFDIERIDLSSQSDGITQQDFMERPLPQFEKHQFDIISLSLVLNFVASPNDRGEMLKRTCRFLDQRAPRTMPEAVQDTLPALFLVLPASSILKSRYMTEERLTLIMAESWLRITQTQAVEEARLLLVGPT